MTKLLDFEFSDYDLVKNENIPTMKVKHWSSDGSYSLSPEWDKKQMMYSSVSSTDDGYDRGDLQDIADYFNSYDNLPEDYKEARKQAVEHLIKYNKRKIEESKEELVKLSSLQQEIGKPEV